MTQQIGQELQHPIILEIIAEDPHDADPIAIGEVGREIIDEMKQDGFNVKPKYTGQRGGLEMLFEILLHVQNTAQAIGVDIYNDRDVIANLTKILGYVSPVVMFALNARKKKMEKQATTTQTSAQEQSIKVNIVIDGASVPVEVSNLKDAEAVLELAKKLHSAHPKVNATPQSEVKVQAVVPKKERRGRR